MTAPHALARRVLAICCALAPPAAALAAEALYLPASEAPATVLGPSRSARLGTQVVAARLDADAIADLVVESVWRPATAAAGGGAIDILRGRRSWPEVLDMAVAPADAAIRPAVGSTLALAAVGDVDGDGIDEVVARVTSTTGESRLVAWGGARLAGAASEATARTVVLGAVELPVRGALVADIDGDGADDLLVRVTDVPLGREALLAYRGGAALPSRIDLAVDAPFTRIDAPVVRNDGPAGAWAAGDVTGDGRADVVMGAGGWWTESPETCVIVTGLAAWPARVDAVTAPNRVLFSGRRWQHAVVGDVTGDGVGDLIVSNDTYREQSLALMAGPVDPSDAPLRILPRIASEPSFPLAVADADGDGVADLVLGAHGDGARGRHQGAGEIAVVRGPLPRTGTLSLRADPPALRILGAAGDWLATAAVGDVDGDLRPDFACASNGSRGSAPDAEGAGALRLLLGAADVARPAAPAVLHVDASAGDDGADGLSWATALASVGEALRRGDALVGNLEIRVAAGSYRERVTVGYDTTISGGWRPRSGDRNPSAARTTLDGELLGTVIEIFGADDSPPTRIDGLVITRGRAHYGAGALVRGGEAVFVNDEFTGNAGVREWTSVSCGTDEHGCPVVAVTDSCSGEGISIYAQGTSRVRLVNGLIHDETLEELGPWPGWGGSGSPTCMPTPCSDENLGSVVRVEHVADLELRNTTIADSVVGVMLYGGYGADRVIENCIVSGLTKYALRGATDEARIDGNLFDRDPAIPLPPGNVVGDPGFVDRARYELEHVDAGQGSTSAAVDGALSASADACLVPEPCLDAFSTRTDGAPDASKLDLGFHRFANEPPVFGGVLRATASGSCAVTVEWSAATDPEGRAVVYDVHRADDSGSPPVLAGSVAAPARSFVDRGLPWDTRWTWSVRARDPGGMTDANVAEAGALVRDETAPAARVVSASSDGACGVSVAFDAADGCSGVSRLELHRSDDPAFVPSAATLLAVDAASPLQDAHAQNGRYAYRVVARDRAGFSTTSDARIAWVGTCAGAIPPPAEAMIPRVERDGPGVRIGIVPAEGAEFHRILEGDIRSLPSGYTHLATPGGVGACRFDGTLASVPMPAGDRYFLARGVNAAGDGLMGADSLGRGHPEPSQPCP